MIHPTARACALCGSAAIKPCRNIIRTYRGTDYALVLGKCAACSFVFLQNDPQIACERDYLDQEQVMTHGDLLARFRAEERVAGIARVVPPGGRSRFLDIGIGDGLLLSVAEAAGFTTFGLDINPDTAEIARGFRVRADVRVEPLPGAFPGATFDVIHMNEVVEHLPDPMAVLRWCREHLSPDGCLVIQTGNIDFWASRIRGSSWDYIRPVHVSYFSTATLSSAACKTGFRIIRRATADWRVWPSLRMAVSLSRQRVGDGLRFLLLCVTALPPGLRRTVMLYARAAGGV